MLHVWGRRGYSDSCRIRQSGRGEAAGIKRSGLYGPLATDRWRDGNIGAQGEQVAQSGAVNRREKLRIFSLRIQIGKAKVRINLKHLAISDPAEHVTQRQIRYQGTTPGGHAARPETKKSR